MFVVQDTKYFPGMKDLEKGFGATSYKVYGSTGNMLEKISSGEHLLGYNVLGSYAMVRAKKDPGLGVVLPKDYTLVLSRVIFIGKNAKNPNAAKLWVDYVLSQRGQKMIGSDVELYSIRDDVDAPYTAAKLKAELGANIKPIPVSAEITEMLDSKKRLDFLGEVEGRARHGRQVDVGGPRQPDARRGQAPAGHFFVARAHDLRDGGGGVGAALAHHLPVVAVGAVLRGQQDDRPRRVQVHLRRIRISGRRAGIRSASPRA